MHSWRNENQTSLRGDFTVNKVQPPKQFFLRFLCIHDVMKTPLRGDFTVNKVQPPNQFDYLSFLTRKCAKNIEGRVDLGSIEMRNDQGSSSPMKRCELTKVERTRVRVDHTPQSTTLRPRVTKSIMAATDPPDMRNSRHFSL